MAEEISVDGVKVCIALPCYSGYVPLEMLLAFAELSTLCEKYGVVVSILAERGNSLPTTARNNLISRFMDTDAEYLFWIDDDIVFSVQDFFQLLAIATKKKSVAATYCCRKDEPVFFIQPIDGKNITFDEDGMIKAKGVGLGFSCQHRSILEPLFNEAEPYTDKDSTPLRDVFKTEIKDGKFTGEDYYFFHKLFENGHITYIHPLIHLKHVGRKDYDHRLMTEKGDLNGCSS